MDNRGVWHPEPPVPLPRALVMPTAAAARQIVRAVGRRRREIVVTAHVKLGVFLQRHAPWLVAWAIRRFGIRSHGAPRPAARAK